MAFDEIEDIRYILRCGILEKSFNAGGRNSADSHALLQPHSTVLLFQGQRNSLRWEREEAVRGLASKTKKPKSCNRM